MVFQNLKEQDGWKEQNKIKTEKKSFDFECKLGKQATRVLFRYVMLCFVLFLFCFVIGLIEKKEYSNITKTKTIKKKPNKQKSMSK